MFGSNPKFQQNMEQPKIPITKFMELHSENITDERTPRYNYILGLNRLEQVGEAPKKINKKVD